MYAIVTLVNNKTKKIFQRKFDSQYLLKQFLNKCNYSKVVKVIGVEYPHKERMEKV